GMRRPAGGDAPPQPLAGQSPGGVLFQARWSAFEGATCCRPWADLAGRGPGNKLPPRKPARPRALPPPGLEVDARRERKLGPRPRPLPSSCAGRAGPGWVVAAGMGCGAVGMVARSILLAGCLLLGLVALFPARRERVHGNPAEEGRARLSTREEPDLPRVFLFAVVSDRIHAYQVQSDREGHRILTEIDTGRLLAEALLILAASGICLAVIPRWRPPPNQTLQPTGHANEAPRGSAVSPA